MRNFRAAIGFLYGALTAVRTFIHVTPDTTNTRRITAEFPKRRGTESIDTGWIYLERVRVVDNFPSHRSAPESGSRDLLDCLGFCHVRV